MTNTKYKLRYLPLFYKDLEEKVVYIAGNDKIMEIRRFLYNKQNYTKLI